MSWVGGSGDWNTATNWSTGALPGPGDDVVISPVDMSSTITHSSGAHTVNSLMSQVAFQLTGGSLTVSNTVQVNNTFTLAGGTLFQATVLQGTNGAAFVVNGSGTLDGVTVNGVLDVGNTYGGARLAVLDGLTLNGTCYVGNPTNGWTGQVNSRKPEPGWQWNDSVRERLLGFGVWLEFIGGGQRRDDTNDGAGDHCAGPVRTGGAGNGFIGGPQNVGVINRGLSRQTGQSTSQRSPLRTREYCGRRRQRRQPLNYRVPIGTARAGW